MQKILEWKTISTLGFLDEPFCFLFTAIPCLRLRAGFLSWGVTRSDTENSLPSHWSDDLHWQPPSSRGHQGDD